MAASRYPLAASRDGLIPEFFQRTNARFRTPHVAIMCTGGLMIVALFFKLKILVEVASAALILTYLFSCLSVVMMRQSRLQNYQPRFKAPFYPWVQIAGIAGYGFLLYEMGGEALLVAGVLVAAGLLTYWFHGRMKANREYALLHLVERITAKELVTGTLDAELKQIIRERDGIVMDRFDRIVEKSIVLDLDKQMSMNAFFELLAEKLAERVHMSPPKLLERLIAREEDSSTVLSPGLAIPHIVIDGEKTFDVLLVRSRPGIVFKEDEEPVRSAFVLIGTADERNFHLRALSAIAQIVQDPRFERTWLAARGEQALRDILLLGQRRRH
jgi:mannitol/fructose-specific phosphotransferase system IIA component (Ntr-type)